MQLDVEAARAAVEPVARRARARARCALAEGIWPSSTRRWRTRSARSRSAAGSTRASSRCSPSAAPARCTRSWLARGARDRARSSCPPSPGTLSAWGMLQTDIRHDFVRAFSVPLRDVEPDDAAGVARSWRGGAASSLRARASTRRRCRCDVADLRYRGQEYALNVPLAPTTATRPSASRAPSPTRTTRATATRTRRARRVREPPRGRARRGRPRRAAPLAADGERGARARGGVAAVFEGEPLDDPALRARRARHGQRA